ncbi:hypothetical protein CsSME_00045692 [Camellia sinensis var. sinensis]|uniref:Receptor-like serine/threonine-protein kinase n=1 Tax=Camellia sinensis var. sinensis TaxID=542762 RepID=A0A4S4CX52_CAMSN|nr:putative receptor protein kinase ZmPK1 [Camellia sinensis]THF94459.1 hypothetical protein TEA_020671 [Camellia sinensis var. sinensis]
MATLFVFLALYLVLSSPTSSSPSHSLSKSSSLSVEKPDHVLISPNGVFSAGFHPVGVNAYSFAIWFTKTTQNHTTVIWMANRDQPVNGRLSKLSLLKDGNLILTDANNRWSIFWATNTASSSLSLQLQLQNSGNLVLNDLEGGVNLWQSFDSPTDTLVPNQVLTRYTELVSKRSEANHSSGFYKLIFDRDNVLRLVFDGPETSSIYWPDPWLLSNEANRSRYNDTRIAVFDSLGHFMSSDRFESKGADFGRGPKRRLTLDFDGDLRLYSLEETSGNWVVSWQAMSRPCRIHGACGPNSICNFDPSSGRKCSCLPWFKMRNPKDWFDGCEPEFNLSCNGGNRSPTTFLKLPHTDFYGYNIHILRNYTLERCEKKCLESCNCKGFHYRFKKDNGVYDCYTKWAFRNGHHSPNFVGTLYVKMPNALMSIIHEKEPLFTYFKFKWNCSGQAMKQLNRTYEKRNQNGSWEQLLWFACVLGVLEMITVSLVSCYLYRTHKNSLAKHEYYFPIVAATGFRKFSYEELKKATRGFREEIGRGGGGVVYKGVFPDNHDHRIAAIKKLNQANCPGEEEFLAEANTIGKFNHMNLIEMWGYCAEGKHRLLVYKYMEHGSLADNLSSNTLDWEKRFEIALGIAKGLAYLHEECLEWVLHCDVKPQNILLDTNFQPKVADFGLSKLVNRGSVNSNSNFSSRIRGTRGYMAPEWIFSLPITSKVDVYSYGVVVLELVTGKNPTTGFNSLCNRGMEETTWVKWVMEKVMNRGSPMTLWVDEIVDPLLNGAYDAGKVEKLVEVALQCLEEEKDARPTMTWVVDMLQR